MFDKNCEITIKIVLFLFIFEAEKGFHEHSLKMSFTIQMQFLVPYLNI